MQTNADIVQIAATDDILQMASDITQIQDGSQTPDTGDIVATASDIQPLKRALVRNKSLEFR